MTSIKALQIQLLNSRWHWFPLSLLGLIGAQFLMLSYACIIMYLWVVALTLAH